MPGRRGGNIHGTRGARRGPNHAVPVILTYVPTTSLVIKYRPARIGFLIRRGSRDDFLTAVRINTLLWGGKFNPCLPISANDTAWADELLELFPVDFLYAVSDAPELNAFKERYPFLSQTHRHAGSVFQEDWRSKKHEPQFLDIKNVIDRYWSEEFRHKPEEFVSNFVLPRWESSDPLHALFATLFGQFPTPDEAKNLRYNYERSYLKGLKASELVMPQAGVLPAEIVDHITPMTTTTLDLIGYGSSRPTSGDGVYVGNAGDYRQATPVPTCALPMPPLPLLAPRGNRVLVMTMQRAYTQRFAVPPRFPDQNPGVPAASNPTRLHTPNHSGHPQSVRRDAGFGSNTRRRPDSLSYTAVVHCDFARRLAQGVRLCTGPYHGTHRGVIVQLLPPLTSPASAG